MYVVIFCDMEGISCIEHWDQVTGGKALYEECRKLYTDEMNAAVRGAGTANRCIHLIRIELAALFVERLSAGYLVPVFYTRNPFHIAENNNVHAYPLKLHVFLSFPSLSL